MKHSLKILLILTGFFLLAQLIGLAVINQYVDKEIVIVDNQTITKVTYQDLPGNMERPEMDARYSFLFITFAVLFGTVLAFILMKFKKKRTWKFWFFLAAMFTMTVAFKAFIPENPAFILAIILAFYKIYRPNFYVHNLTELFIYGGLAAVFVPIMDLFSATMMLVIISIYDMYAVWKSKHMITLAKAQTENKIFAGLAVPYSLPKKGQKMIIGANETEVETNTKSKTTTKKTTQAETVSTAILGGGDIGFPLIFGGVVLKTSTMLHSITISLFTTIALFLLLYYGKKGKFYPAMPYISVGVFIGYGIGLLF